MDELAPAHVLHQSGHYGIPDPDLPLHDERKASLHDLARREGNTLGYEYDLGASREHEIRLEKLVSADPNSRYPAGVAGERSCPPEACDAIPGYQDLIATLADPDHPDHEDMLLRLGIDKGSDFDPTRFDLDDANRRLDAVARRVWHRMTPTRGPLGTHMARKRAPSALKSLRARTSPVWCLTPYSTPTLISSWRPKGSPRASRRHHLGVGR